jgi:tRNA (guanine37-N1)-methyltransferase
MHIDILSLFPEYFESPFKVSILKRAIDKGLINIRQLNIRDFSKDKHKKVDDRPFGGGPGMVMTAQPIVDAISSIKKKKSHVVCLSPQGKLLNAKTCQRLSKKSHLILLCGHYEGIDERVIQTHVDEEISIGDYVLTNGCLSSIVLIDAIARFIPEVLGNPDAVNKDSFEQIIFDSPQYTRPDIFEGTAIPEVLKNGNHAEIESWRLQQGLKKTRRVRPDLYRNYLLKYMLTRIINKKHGGKNSEPTSSTRKY